MSYENALKAAGAEIHTFQQFGSYQGEWWAKVTHNGETGWINGSYGSCSGCDAFEGEFGYAECPVLGEKFWKNDEYVYATQDDVNQFQKRLESFGKVYLDTLLSQEQAESEASRNIDWDGEAESMLNFIRTNR
jgi:hypothetical protein